MALDLLNPAALLLIAIGLLALFYAYRLTPALRWASAPVKATLKAANDDPDTLPLPPEAARAIHSALISRGFVLFLYEVNEHQIGSVADHWYYYHEPGAPEVLIEFFVPRKRQVTQVIALSVFPDGACVQTEYPYSAQTLHLPDLILTYAKYSLPAMLDAHRQRVEEWRALRGDPLPLRTADDLRAFEAGYWARHAPVISRAIADHLRVSFNLAIWGGIGMIFTGVIVMIPAIQPAFLVVFPLIVLGLWGMHRVMKRRLALIHGENKPVDHALKRVEGVHPLQRGQS